MVSLNIAQSHVCLSGGLVRGGWVPVYQPHSQTKITCHRCEWTCVCVCVCVCVVCVCLCGVGGGHRHGEIVEAYPRVALLDCFRILPDLWSRPGSRRRIDGRTGVWDVDGGPGWLGNASVEHGSAVELHQGVRVRQHPWVGETRSMTAGIVGGLIAVFFDSIIVKRFKNQHNR